ncbi:hypothetical protein SAMN04487907_106103 [Zunongwangia mangrovi]|uniref:WD40-like Beta Propeller Repeat n=1 Tax=Zunongwangia mangrovi TaxID=1334022 RepID=A0A1I1KX31_9FLAO|nr:hypothetical protein [Zunongwangia mangrovi]SFC62693.1 hypothetical protein SAMN04487907_106103 [Zunongwangia mangrovi]
MIFSKSHIPRFCIFFFSLFMLNNLPGRAQESRIVKKISTEVKTTDWKKTEAFETSYDKDEVLEATAYKKEPKVIGVVDVEEASGLAYSVANPGMLWTHNDSGNDNELFLINAQTAELEATYEIKGIKNKDWEDVEVTIDPRSGEPYIYVSDTGDNKEDRKNYKVYRFKEPVFKKGDKKEKWKPKGLSEIKLNYPDKHHDAEAIFVDPFTQDFFLVTKRDSRSIVYVLPFPAKKEKKNKLIKVGELSFDRVSAANFSLDGKRLVIKNREEIFYWERENRESTLEMLRRDPKKAPYIVEAQGEAICFDKDGNYFTLSEAADEPEDAKLYKYLLK